MRWRWCTAFSDDALIINVHVVFKLHNYKTPRLAAYDNDSADARSMAYTEILSVFAIVYGTDNIPVVVDSVRREFVSERSCMF